MKHDLAPDVEIARAERVAWVKRAEWIVAIAVSAVAVSLLAVRVTHAGALWRDEVDSVQSAQLPLGEMFHAVQFSSFPILFPLIVRAHMTLFGAGDPSLRCFGFVVGVLLIAAAWLPIRRLTGNVPLLLPAMVGLNANFLAAGVSLRGYGFGSALVLLSFVCTGKFLVNPTFPALLAVFVADILAAQCLFWNVPLIFAITFAAIGVLLVRREAKWIWLLLAVLVVCGLSEIFYLVQFHSSLSNWGKIIQLPVSLALVWQPFLMGWVGVSPTISTIWLALVFLGLAGGLWPLVTTWRKCHPNQRDLLLFGILLIPLAIVASYAFAVVIQRASSERFFLALTILVAAAADLSWASCFRSLRILRIALLIAATTTLPFALWNSIIRPESNVETIAKILERNAPSRDLVVVNPWTYGISFNWYYHGAAHWVTVPEIEDHRIHRYDLVWRKMEATSPLAEVEEEIATTLKSGNRIWLLGAAELPAPGGDRVNLDSAPDPRLGVVGNAYRSTWSKEIGLFIAQQAQDIIPVDTRPNQKVGPHENMSLYQVKGWKD